MAVLMERRPHVRYDLERLEESLVRLLGSENVSRGRPAIERHSFDALRPSRGFPVPPRGFPPDVVVTPRSTAQVVAVVELAKERRVPLVPWGAGTGLMGGAEAVDGGVTVDLSRMSRVLRFERAERTVEVESGATIGAVNRYLLREGFFLAHDPWTRDFATVGGAISTNGMGYLGTRYGTMGDQVLGLQVVLPDGSVLQTEPLPARSGFHLNGLFVGTEGCFGLITRATLRCYPKPQREVHLAFEFKDFERAFRAAIEVDELEITALDMLGTGRRPECELHVTIAGRRGGDARLKAERCLRALRSRGGRPLSHRRAQAYWDRRHRAAEEYVKKVSESPLDDGRAPGSFDYLHVAVPLASMLGFWEVAKTIVRDKGLTIDTYGIYCHPGLFSLSLERRDEGAPPENLEAAVDQIVEEAVRRGGYLEFVHGIGVRYARLQKVQNGQGQSLVVRMKRCLDPEGIMNPGKLGPVF